jgi:hypothetical protein
VGWSGGADRAHARRWNGADAARACRSNPQERTKVKALSEELENPLNVHRWRKLEGSDPGTYEMIQKIQTLQKRLIAKTEEVVEKDLLIQVRTPVRNRSNRKCCRCLCV